MNRRIFIVSVLGAAAAFAADPLPSAESILDRYIEVTGGKQAYQTRKTEITNGTVEYPSLGIKGTIVRYAAAPDNYYSTLEIEGLGKVEMGVSGGVAWENSALLGPRIKSGVERAEAIREGTLNANLEWRRLYSKVAVEGVETIDGEECYKVVMTPAEGNPETTYFQKKSGLAVKTSAVTITQMGEIPIELVVVEYKKLGGILAPSKVTQKAGAQEFTITMQSVEANPVIPQTRFALPAEVQALAAKGKP
jgi:hypothetical protein